jgi:hypothetical protein
VAGEACDLVAPALGALDLVEGVEVQAGDPVVGPGEVGSEALEEALRAVAV